MSDDDMPAETDPKAAANVALVLLTHTLAFLLRRQRISRAELDEIFGTVTKAYSEPHMPAPTQTWQKQIQPLVTLTHSDVLRWAQAD
jgi:hypothetical protein